MPGDAALAAFVVCVGTPTLDHQLDVHVDVMQVLRPFSDKANGTAVADVTPLTAEWSATTLGYLDSCRSEMGKKGFPDEWVEPTRTLRDWLKESTTQVKANGKT